MKKINFQPFLRIIIFLILTYVSIKIFDSYTNILEFKKHDLLGILISSISIIIAIIITYLFSKLFAEKTERVQRKSDIDLLSHKITAFRKLAFQVKGFYEFWKFGEKNVKGIIERKYKNLSLEDIATNKIKFEQLKEIEKEVGSRALQGYLGIKGLENHEKTIKFYQTFTPTNYTLKVKTYPF